MEFAPLWNQASTDGVTSGNYSRPMNNLLNHSTSPSIPPWLPEARRALVGLGLTPDWPEETVPVPGTRASRAADCALRLLAELGLKPDRVLPSLEGGVCLVFTLEDLYADVQFFDSGEVIATCSRGDWGTPRVWSVEGDLKSAFSTILNFFAG